MKKIQNKSYGGERPLYASHSLELENVTILEGESALKECSNITAHGCRFEGNYPLWRTFGLKMTDCTIVESSRAALWYTTDLVMTDSLVEGPKVLREMDDITLERVNFPKAVETLWKCRNVKMRDCTVKQGDYLLMGSENVEIDNLFLQGKYTFQYVKNIVIRNSVLDTKDAFWESDNCTIYDSEVKGEFLAWHSRNLRLVRCHISGSQPLCYAEGLVLEDCTFDPEADLAFEYSDVKATIHSGIKSIKNPRTGYINIDSVGEIIIDENLIKGSNCKIEVKEQ